MGQAMTLEIRGMAVAAGGRDLLEGVDLTLAPGEARALAGPSGCGKSTLLRAVAGLDDPRAGSLHLAGRAPAQWGWPEYRRRVVLSFQKPVFLEASLETNLRRPFLYHHAPGDYPEGRARELAERLGLAEIWHAPDARRLSQGEQQRLALIRALLLEPEVLLLDEPTSALDNAAAAAVEALLLEERSRRGMALLMASHDPAQAGRMEAPVLDLAAHRPTAVRS